MKVDTHRVLWGNVLLLTCAIIVSWLDNSFIYPVYCTFVKMSHMLHQEQSSQWSTGTVDVYACTVKQILSRCTHVWIILHTGVGEGLDFCTAKQLLSRCSPVNNTWHWCWGTPRLLYKSCLDVHMWIILSTGVGSVFMMSHISYIKDLLLSFSTACP